MSDIKIPIPSGSAKAFRDHQGITNPGLIFDRFAPDWGSNSTLKKQGLERVANATTDKKLLTEWNARWQACAQAAGGKPFGLKTDWRLIAGLGRKGPLEVGFTFHRYGFPILPGSSVKGVARAWALIQIARQAHAPKLDALDESLSADGDKERKKYQEWRTSQSADVQQLADDFRAIFGTTATAGRAVFFDAIPSKLPKLELDIMNPHFPDYYQGKQPPTDWQSPVPVYFLTVAANTEFRFAVGWRGALDAEGGRLRDLAQKWLVEGLTQLGAGAKTGAGYGYFAAPPQAAQDAGQAQQSLSVKSAGQAQAAASTASATAPQTLTWRTGTIKEYQPDKGTGRLVDDESGAELTFKWEAIEDKGWSPGRRYKVRYALADEAGKPRIVKVKRAQA